MRRSLKKKVPLFIVVACVLISIAMLVIVEGSLRDVDDRHHMSDAVDLARTVSVSLDSDSVHVVRDEVDAIYDRATHRTDADQQPYASVKRGADYQYLCNQMERIRSVNHAQALSLAYVDEKPSRWSIWRVQAATTTRVFPVTRRRCKATSSTFWTTRHKGWGHGSSIRQIVDGA